jgi:cytochrome c peroxidase
MNNRIKIFFNHDLLSILVSGLFFSIILTSCSDNSSNINEVSNKNKYLKIPKGFPAIKFPDSNPYSDAKFELGRMLFYDPIVVKDSSFPSCSHCMQQEHAFSSCIRYSYGANNEPQSRNNMTLVNSGYRSVYFWDARGKAVETTAYRSFWMPDIFNSDTNDIINRFNKHPIYPTMFKNAFGNDAKPSIYLASQAIGVFVRSLISGNSKYDRYINGDKTAMNESEIEGMKLFFSDRTKCSVCHSGIMFTDQKLHTTGYSTHYFDIGRAKITGKEEDKYKFLTPTLRNVALSEPYMHDGALATLWDVVDHYNHGGKTMAQKDTLIKPINLNQNELISLVNFLKSLTDDEFINNPIYSTPFK